MKKLFPIFLIAFLIAMTDSCYPSIFSFMERSHSSREAALKAGFNKEYIKAGNFNLMTYHRFRKPSDTIRIYIEGDGRAWETRTRLSGDPTPSDPVALNLSVVDSFDAIAYIARPGQFPDPDSQAIDPTYWSQKRFSQEVINAISEAIDVLKIKSNANKIELIGYSGGAAIAVLIAAERNDISSVRTIAGNLDPKALCAFHKVSLLEGSLDPIDVAQKVAIIPQRHFVGSKDKIVPRAIIESFVKKCGDSNYKNITVVDGATHSDGWREHWKELLSMPMSH